MKTMYKNHQIPGCRIMAFVQSNFLKITLLIVFSALLSNANARNFYVATNGNDNNTGTITSPFKNWQKLSSVMVAGDIAYIRGGTYITPYTALNVYIHCLWSGMNGTALNPIIIQNYPGESPVFDFSSLGNSNRDYAQALYIENCSYLTVKGLRITGMKQILDGSGICIGNSIMSSNFITLERMEIDHMGGTGFRTGNSNDVTYINCDAHHNDDRYSQGDPWGGTDGFTGSGGESSTRTKYIGCRSWWNSDDGWDFYGTDGKRTMINCWSFWNGYQPGTFVQAGNGDGFKLGPTATNQSGSVTKLLNNCLSFENRSIGFSQDGNGQTKYQLYNNTAYKNGSHGFWWGNYAGIIQDFKNNISWANQGSQIAHLGQATGSNNSWNGGAAITNYDFLSVSSYGVDGPRQPDGSLPIINFLKLAQGSNLIDAGVNVGLPFAGFAPDKGFDEFGLISLPIHDVSLTGRTDNEKHVLNWSIIADEPIKTILIESSADGVNYTLLTTAHPTSQSYTYQPYSSSTIFYRLKVTSVIDQTVYSNIVALKNTGTAEKQFTVSTLVQSGITINAPTTYLYFLSDASGRVISTGNGIKGSNRIDMSSRPGGIYFIQLINTDKNSASYNNKETQKIIKQ